MHARTASAIFVAAAVGLWLLFLVLALHAPVVLDDWFQLRYWRDHAFGATALWDYAHHNYLHYNPRIGEVFLAIIDGSRALHLIVTPLVQLAVLPTVFVMAYGRWPRRTIADLQLLLFIQVMIWLVIPIPGIMYFYRPFATNYLWAFAITLALLVPYRLALAADSPSSKRRLWLVPIMLALGWVAGMCNEHTGPTAMVAMAGFVVGAWRLRRLRAWMIAGLVGLYVGYPMLFFAPGQSVRYGGIAERETPVMLLEVRGVTGCLAILGDFLYESRLGIIVFVAAVVRYVATRNYRGHRGYRASLPPRRDLIGAGVLAAAAAAIVVTLFVSPATTDRVFYASGVLLVATFAVLAQHMFAEPHVRRFVVAGCVVVLAYHVVRFVDVAIDVKAASDARIAALAAAAPGTIAVVPRSDEPRRSRWHMSDDFDSYPWLRDYVGGELFDLARVDLDRRAPPAIVHEVATRTYEPPLAPELAAASTPTAPLPTYRQLQSTAAAWLAAEQRAQPSGHALVQLTITAAGVYDDARHRPVVMLDAAGTGASYAFVDGRPDDEARGHFIRVRRATMPAHVESSFVIGCHDVRRTEPVVDDDRADVLLPVDERFCRGPFTAVVCEPDRCWIAGWY